MERYRAIQFIGTQRSGSNLLRLILNQHENISAPHPPHLLKTFIPLLSKYSSLQKGMVNIELVNDMCRLVECNPVEWTDVSLDREEITSLSEDIFDIFKRIYLNKAQCDNASIWCCKSTFNINYVKGLERKIKPFYIYLYRDGRDVAVSFKKAITGPKHIYHLAKKWGEEQIACKKFLTTIADSRYISISYESLLKNPEDIIKNICLKIGISYNSRMMEYYNSEESKHTAESGQMWENVIKPVMQKNMNKYSSELTNQDIALFERMSSDQLIDLGYAISTTPSERQDVKIDINEFKKNNAILIKNSIANAPINDIEHRKKQQELLHEIKGRVSTI